MPDAFPVRSLASLRDHLLNPYPWYRRMRGSRPVVYDPRENGWHVFGYDDVARVLSESATFSSHFRGLGGGLFADTLIDTDPPQHHRLRTLVSQAFTPRAVEALAPRVRALADDLLDRVVAAGRMEVIRDLAYPLPALVIAELMGLPAADCDRLKRWSDVLVAIPSPALGAAYQEMTAYFTDVCERRRREPRPDLVGRLLAARVEDNRLSPREMVDFCSLLLISGHETTTHLIGDALACLTDHPELWERLQGEPGLVASAIEEVARYRSPVQSMSRRAVADTTLGGQAVRVGSRVTAWIGSANHDEARFAEPERLDAARQPNPHLAFGRGAHYCLGAPLARLEAVVVLTALLERLRDIRRLPGVRLEPFPSTVVHGLRRLPVALTAR